MSGIRKRSADDIRRDNQIKKLTLQNGDLEAKLEYVAIMADIDIDEDTEPEEVEENV